VGGSLILETTFLVDLERELNRGREGAAHQFLDRRRRDRFYITPTIAGELAAGASLAERKAWEGFVRPFGILEMNEEVWWQYGQLYRYLSDNGMLIGSNDLWIAASGVAYAMTVVTRNQRHYRRVPGLTVADYGS
jgi:predicted nucleic acid-binding protein